MWVFGGGGGVDYSGVVGLATVFCNVQLQHGSRRAHTLHSILGGEYRVHHTTIGMLPVSE